jgi:hypothetical protein
MGCNCSSLTQNPLLLDTDLSVLLCLIQVFVESKILYVDRRRHELSTHIFY